MECRDQKKYWVKQGKKGRGIFEGCENGSRIDLDFTLNMGVFVL